MKIGTLSTFIALFAMYGTDCSAVEKNNDQQQAYSDSENSEKSGSAKIYRPRKRPASVNDGSKAELISKFGRRKRRRKIGLSQGTERSVVQTEISENAEPTNTECEACKAHSMMNNESEPMMREEDKYSFENSTVDEPNDDTTECETCKSQGLKTDSLKALKNLGKMNSETKLRKLNVRK